MSSHVQQAGLFSGRQVTLMAVMGLHALMISALIAIRIVPELTMPGTVIDVIPIDPVVRPDEVPRVPQPDRPTVERIIAPLPLPIPDLPGFEAAQQHSLPAQEGMLISDTPAVSGSGSTGATPVIASTGLQYRIVRPSDDYYPNASVMLEERGIAIVQVCVDAAGRIDGQPSIQTSSGYRRLDQAAVRWARESLRFTPATVDGAAVAACKGFRVNFNLR